MAWMALYTLQGQRGLHRNDDAKPVTGGIGIPHRTKLLRHYPGQHTRKPAQPYSRKFYQTQSMFFIPLRAKQVREVANLTERKNLHTPVYGVKEFVCLSVSLSLCLSVINFDHNFLRTG